MTTPTLEERLRVLAESLGYLASDVPAFLSAAAIGAELAYEDAARIADVESNAATKDAAKAIIREGRWAQRSAGKP